MSATGYVYAIGSGNAVKIGFAKDPVRRLSELNVGSPTDHVLVGMFPGTKDDERFCHQECSAHRIRGEWFRKEGAVEEILTLFTLPQPQKCPDFVVTPRMTFKDLIDKIGAAPLAALLSVEDSHVRTMKARDSIPPEYWSLVVDEAQRRGISEISFDTLHQMRAERFARAADGFTHPRAAE